MFWLLYQFEDVSIDNILSILFILHSITLYVYKTRVQDVFGNKQSFHFFNVLTEKGN